MGVKSFELCVLYFVLGRNFLKSTKREEPSTKLTEQSSRNKSQNSKTKVPRPKTSSSTSSPVPLLSILSTRGWDRHQDPASLVLVATLPERFADLL